MTDKLSSLEEKRRSFLNNGDIERWMFVQELIDLLSTLRPDDYVMVNDVGNLLIFRVDKPIGCIDTAFNTIDYFDVEKEE